MDIGLLAPRSSWYGMFLFISTIIFSIEYVLRLWSCVEDERYHGAILGRYESTALEWCVLMKG